jgi:hypothetical protein
MAIRIPIITDLQDQGIRRAKDAFGDFKKAVGNAEGGLGKFKAGSKVAFDSIKANAGLFAVAAGAAIGKFAFQAIGDFQDLALAAGKFSDATGLAVEDASRYMEAAGDIGVPVDALEGAIGRLNRTIGADPDKVRDLGVDLVYLKDGSLDVNETFLNTIERIKGIKDPAEKAKVAAQLLGKGWQSMSELIEMGADDLKKSLDSVSDSKIIDKDEVDKAKDYRAATDDLKDAFEDMAIKLGERLIPKVTLLVEVLATLPESLRGAGGVVEMTTEEMAAFGDKTAIAKLEIERLAEMYGGYYASRVQGAKDDTYMLEQQMLDLEEATTDTDKAFQDLKDELNLQSAVVEAKEQLGELQEKAVAAFQGADGALGEYEQGLIDAKLLVLELAESIVLTQGQKDKIRVLVDTGDLEYALALIDSIGSGGHADLVADAAGKALASGRSLRIPGRALGGPVMGGSSYLVGERGPELFTPSSSGNITPNGAMGGMVGGNTITVNVNGGDPNQVVAALQRWVRDNGSVPLAATTAIRR